MPRSDLLSRALDAPADLPLRPLPGVVSTLLRDLAAPPRLAAHLRLVHDVGCELADWFTEFHPAVSFDRDAVLFGAATHDIGKAVHTAELEGPGSAHEPAGRDLLLAHGFPPAPARFAATHAAWAADGVGIEELLVSAADKVWKGARVADLEDLLIDHLVRAAPPGTERWAVYLELDELLGRLADGADARLAFQAAHPVHA
ncbi:HD domain-containing protein [Streptomyces sp. ISL-43]|uniref:HD domain-containing protein n=1 Tax=Streptomyces sp. ISL-43 TaxID=2819183 RepID=UPI001BEB3B9C|nr:HD domain-containing protein [Streptomyces sp. ISL-43]MBT2449549.1 HD domain-containing protein [Streptomyces sp. ISL-43]